MKVLYITLPCFADYMFSLVESSLEHGIDATCILDLNTTSSTIIDIKERISKPGIIKASEYEELRIFNSIISDERLYVANYNPSRKYLYHRFKKLYDLYYFIKVHNFNIIHIDHTFEGLDQLLYIFHKKMVLTQHDPLAHSGMEYSPRTNRLLKRAYKLIPKIVIHNKTQLNEFCSTYSINQERVLVNYMPLYTCLDVFTDSRIIRNKKKILFFGRISKYKGLEYLCESMVKVHNVVPDATLSIIGGGNFYFDFSLYSNLEYISIRNTYISIHDLVKQLQECAFVVCPYVDATQSGVVMTCNALGVPAIVTNVGGLPEMVDDGKSGIIVQPKDSCELADAIISLLKDTNKLDTMYLYLNKMYKNGPRSSKNITQRYIDFYNKQI